MDNTGKYEIIHKRRVTDISGNDDSTSCGPMCVLPSDHDKHHEYLRICIEREARRSAFQRAVIEKTLVSLLWSGITGGAILIYNLVKDHWK
jgi:hypothetical protein